MGGLELVDKVRDLLPHHPCDGPNCPMADHDLVGLDDLVERGCRLLLQASPARIGFPLSFRMCPLNTLRFALSEVDAFSSSFSTRSA